MNSTHPTLGLWVIVIATMAAASAAMAQEPATRPTTDTQADLRVQVQDLQAQMQKMQIHEQELEQKLQEQAAAATRPSVAMSPADTAAVVAGLLQDADQRSQLLSVAPMETGYDPSKGFVIASEDGNFVFHPFVLVQVRDVTNAREDDKHHVDTNAENGFEIRRMQIGFDGNLFSPDLTYRVFIQTDREGGVADLYDAWLKYHFAGTPWFVEAGQFKAPLAHEQMVFDRTLLAADRSLVDDILADGEAFSDGVMAIYDNNGPLRAKADFTNGYGTNDLNFEDSNRMTHFGIGTREEYKFMGNWGDYDQFTSLNDKNSLLVAGGGVDWTEANGSDLVRPAADIQWNNGPLGLFGGFTGRYTTNNMKAGDTFDPGAVAQASYLLNPNHLELFLRYDYLDFNGKEFTTPTKEVVHEITIGANYYFFGQNLKITVDGSYLPNGSPVDDNGSGVLVDNGHGEFVGRVQVQLAI